MSQPFTQYKDRLTALRHVLKDHHVDGFVLARTDEYQGEFLAPYAERLAWLSGFTGSAGAAVVLADKAVVMSDGRYTLQLAEQVPAELYDVADSTCVGIGQWLADQGAGDVVIGYDPWLHTQAQIDKIMADYGRDGLVLKPMDINPVDAIWDTQPTKPAAPVAVFPDAVAGQSSAEKRMAVAAALAAQDCAACLLTAGDSVAWLLNIRGADIDFSPLVLSFAVLHADGRVDWCVDPTKIGDDVRTALGQNVQIRPEAEIADVLRGVDGRLWLDQKTAAVWFSHFCQAAGIAVLDRDDPCSLPKSLKTAAEQKAIRAAHVADGVAVVKFLKWVDDTANVTPFDEIDAEDMLEAFRREHEDYLGASFSTIAGFADHGAIVHYRAEKDTAHIIAGNSLLLVDSGGQYRWGTTDITRTVAIGTPSAAMREHYTRVLQGHIAISMAHFPRGTTGREIDALARAPLQEVGLDYAHGTGHGVGCYLGVHEAAASLSPRCHDAVQAGMLLSNEPGYYEDGAYGIRIENLILAHGVDGGDLAFETVTLAPYDTMLIMVDMLNTAEIAWVQQYEARVWSSLSPYLDNAHRAWLAQSFAFYCP